jgi:acyl-CoA synthetase (AMP-forming)/AMP-acid ligase II/thioesterase domain-containing protein/acyl carrier protein
MTNAATVYRMAELTVSRLIGEAGARHPQNIAIASPGRKPLTYAQLQDQMQLLGSQMKAAGITRGHRVATLLPAGPEAAVLSLAVMAHASLAPLNPGANRGELARYLTALRANAVVVHEDVQGPALEVVHELGLSLLRVRRCVEAPAGVHQLVLDRSGSADGGSMAARLDIALVLHTSGTTSDPKIVPLTHHNICVSANNIASSLQLEPRDRCLNVMPLFHVHGLIGGLLSSIAASASVVSPPGFLATEFFDWMDEFNPSWYTAVPTMHQAILTRSERHADVIARRPLRFIRSCSSALPPRVAADLASTFGAPVLEAYGMTESAHQLAVTPLSDARLRPGSVGKASGPELAIMDDDGRLLGPESVGEIVARGETIMAGYENNPVANASAFTNGWLRTGDQGCLTTDGFLFITGRIKELINRAGEKIAPRELDEALLEHPAVAQAIAFALPHPTLGEEPAAAVVLRPNQELQAAELRAHVASRLAAFKVPRVIRIVAEIPNGPTGKPQRTQLPQLLGLVGNPRAAAATTAEGLPQTAAERRMAEIWAKVLRIPRIDVERGHSFFDLGGDSVLAAQLVARIPAGFRVDVSLLDIFEYPTLEAFSRHVEGCRPTDDVARARPTSRCLVPIQTDGDRPPVFAVHGVFGDVACFADLARELGPSQPFYGLQAQGLDGLQPPLTRVVDMARCYIAELRSVQPSGPYRLVGYSSGGSVAFEMARQLEASGEQVVVLAVIDHALHTASYDQPEWSAEYASRVLGNVWRNVPFWAQRTHQLGIRKAAATAAANLKLVTRALRPADRADHKAAWQAFRERTSIAFSEYLSQVADSRLRLIETQHRAVRQYLPQPYSGSVTVLRATRQPLLCSHAPDLGWGNFVSGLVIVKEIPGNHQTILDQPYVVALADELRATLEEAEHSAGYMVAA